MTLFGIIWLIIIILAFSYKNIRPMMYVTIIGMIWQSTDFISMEKFSCGPQLITSIFFIFKFILNMPKISLKINLKNIFLSFIPLLVYILCGYLCSLENISMNHIFNIMIIYIYTITFYCLKKSSEKMEKKYFNKIIVVLSSILLIIGAIQIIISTFNLPKDNIIKELFFNDISNGDTYYYSNSTRFYSTFMEPSYVAGILVGLIMYFLLKTEKRIIDYILMFFLILAMILSYSSTAYGTFAIIMMIYCLKNIKKKKTWWYIIIAIIALLGIACFTDILNDVIFNKSDTGSARQRNRLNQYAINTFLETPLTGKGYKMARASSLFYSLLAELGIIGLILYLLPITKICIEIKKKIDNYQREATIFMVLSMVIAQMIACPDLDLCSFWLSMYLYASAPKDENNKKEIINNEENRNINIS